MTVGSMGGRCISRRPVGFNGPSGPAKSALVRSTTVYVVWSLLRISVRKWCCVEPCAPQPFNGHDVRLMRGVDGVHTSDLLRLA
jgi:hypothetical protein